MKKLLFLLLAMTTFHFANAQDNDKLVEKGDLNSAKYAQLEVRKAVQAYKLSNDQITKVRQILIRKGKQLQELYKATGMKKDTYNTKRANVVFQADHRMRAVLDRTQLIKFNKDRQEALVAERQLRQKELEELKKSGKYEEYKKEMKKN